MFLVVSKPNCRLTRWLRIKFKLLWRVVYRISGSGIELFQILWRVVHRMPCFWWFPNQIFGRMPCFWWFPNQIVRDRAGPDVQNSMLRAGTHESTGVFLPCALPESAPDRSVTALGRTSRTPCSE